MNWEPTVKKPVACFFGSQIWVPTLKTIAAQKRWGRTSEWGIGGVAPVQIKSPMLTSKTPWCHHFIDDSCTHSYPCVHCTHYKLPSRSSWKSPSHVMPKVLTISQDIFIYFSYSSVSSLSTELEKVVKSDVQLFLSLSSLDRNFCQTSSNVRSQITPTVFSPTGGFFFPPKIILRIEAMPVLCHTIPQDKYTVW